MAATLALALLLQPGPARAGPVSGVFNIAVYHATGDGSATDAVEQATKANPMLSTPGGCVGATTYAGPLNFNLTAGGTDTTGAFLSSGETYTAFKTSGDALSTAPFAATSLFVITGQGYAARPAASPMTMAPPISSRPRQCSAARTQRRPSAPPSAWRATIRSSFTKGRRLADHAELRGA